MKFEVNWLNRSKDIAFTRDVHSIHFKKFDGGHLVFSRWPKMYSVCPLDNMKTNFKLKLTGEAVLKIQHSRAYITLYYTYFKRLMAAILILADGPKSNFHFQKHYI